MWLSNLFTKTKDNEHEDSINKDKVKKESINISSNHEKESVINDLKTRVEKVKMIHTKLQALQNKQDLNLNNDTTNTLLDKDHQCTSTKKNEKKLELNNCDIEDVLRIIPIIGNNLQTLTEKVSCLSSLLDTNQLNAKIVPEQNINSTNSNINSASNSVNKLNGVVNKRIPKNKDTSLELVSKENNKMHKNKRIAIKKKYSYQKVRTSSNEIISKCDQKDIEKNEENVSSYSVKSIDQLSNLDGQLESFFTKIQSTLTQYKINQGKEKSEIMFNLSRLEDKINLNYTKIDKLMSTIEQLSKINDPANHIKNHLNLEIENKHELQKSIDDIKFCIDYLLKPNPIDKLKTQQSVTIDTPITQTNINGTCTWDQCVCKLIDNSNTNSTPIINSHDAKNQIKYGDIFLCEFLNAKLTSERIKKDEHYQIAQVYHFSNQIGANKISHLSICPKQSNIFSNNYDGNQNIDNQKSSQSSVCSKESNYLKNNDRQPEKPKIKHLIVCPKQSVHHFFNNGVENHTTASNQLNASKSVHKKNKICDFLSSQPIPEWIGLDENLVKSNNLCCKEADKTSSSNSTLNVSKSYNIERIVNESHDKNNIVYEITQNHDVQKEIKIDCIFKEQITPCNSLNNEPWNIE